MRHTIRIIAALSMAAALLISCAPTEPHSVLELPPHEGNSRNSEGDFIALKGGDILFVYSKFIGGKGDDHDKCVIAARVSKDKGESWSEEDQIIAVNEAEPDGNVMSASLLRLQDGRIALFYLQKTAGDIDTVITRVMMKTSADEGKTWSEETDCTAGMEPGYRVVNNARVIRHSSGRVLIPVAWHRFHGPGDYDMDHDAELYTLWSDDDCKTWKRSPGFYINESEDGTGVMVDGCKANQLMMLAEAGVNVGFAGKNVPEGQAAPEVRRVQTQEPGIIELQDGSVLMYIRANTGYQWYAVSRDAGQSWSEVSPAPYVGPLSPATMRRLADGRILNIWNDHEGREDLGQARTPLTLAVSSDEGKTWDARKVLEGSYDPERKRHFHYCYTAALVLRDRILLAYCAEDNLQHLRITSVPLTWLP